VKICHIIDLYEPYAGGGSGTYTQRIASRMAEEHQVIVITQKPYRGVASLAPEIGVRDRARVYRFYPLNLYFTYSADKAPAWMKPFWHLFNLWNPHPYYAIRKILKQEKPDIVHTHTIGGFSLATFSAIKSAGCPHVCTLHGYALLSPWSALMRRDQVIRKFNLWERQFTRFTRFFSMSVDLALFPSQFIMDMHLKNGFFPNSKCLKLPIGIELSGVKKITKDYQTIDILYTGGLIKTKGAQVLIDSFKQLSNPNIRLHIVGRGYYEQELRRMAGSDSRITFHGFVTSEQLNELGLRANVAVIPSLFYENAPAVILESFQAGTPVVGSNIGGIPEIIEDGYNGRLFTAGDSGELKEVLESLVNSPAELERLSKGAAESVKKYDMKQHVKKLVKLYGEVKG